MKETTFRIALAWYDVPQVCIDRGVGRFWFDRIRDMAHHASMVGVRIRGVIGQGLDFDSVRVNRDWPLRGSITLTRTDGTKFRLRMTPKTRVFKVEEVR